MKVRHICAILGVAIAVGTVTFMQGLVATNDHQALAVAERLLKDVPVANEAKVAQFAIDYRPDGKVMQGPPMMAVVASSCASLTSGEGAASPLKGECVITRAMFAQRRLAVPPAGTVLTLIGRKKTHELKIAAVLDWEKPLRGYPNCFVSDETAAAIDEEWRDWQPKTAEELAPAFTSDAGRNMDRAKALLLWAAALTALCLLVNTLFLSIEAKRKEIAILRMVGMTRGGVAARVFSMSFWLAVIGDFLGVAVAWAALWVYVKIDPTTFPMGIGPMKVRGTVFGVTILVSLVASLIALRPALKVKPLEAASNRMPRKKHLGMLIAFACGFGAFVAVEVWGASLMSAFVPSKEWPDAIVSILPGGVSKADLASIGKIPGVAWWKPLVAKQVGTRERNVLLIGSEPTARLPFPKATNECYVTSMMARARQLKVGDEIEGFRIARILDLNWHMVTSRGLLRGLDRRRFDQRTDGPLLVAPWPVRRYTHLWLDYEPDAVRPPDLAFAGSTVRVHLRDEIADGTFAHGNEIVGAMARVPFVFILVISLGFVAMLVASADSRSREFRVLRAVGATKGQLARILVGEALKVAGRGVVLGLFGGALVGWLATGATRAAMANWGIPPSFAVPFAAVAKGAAGAVVFALGVAVPTALALVGRKGKCK